MESLEDSQDQNQDINRNQYDNRPNKPNHNREGYSSNYKTVSLP